MGKYDSVWTLVEHGAQVEQELYVTLQIAPSRRISGVCDDGRSFLMIGKVDPSMCTYVCRSLARFSAYYSSVIAFSQRLGLQ